MAATSQYLTLGLAGETFGISIRNVREILDMEIEFPRPTEDLGRIAAQTAKQVIFQKVREAERENVYAEYSNRVGEVVSGMYDVSGSLTIGALAISSADTG